MAATPSNVLDINGRLVLGNEQLDLIPTVVLCLDRKGNVALINRAGCRALEGKRQELTGRNWLASFVPDGHKQELRALFRKIRDGEISPEATYHENPLLTAKGNIKLFAWRNGAIRDTAGKISYILSFGEDVTERKKAEHELAESERLFRAVTQSVQDAIVGIDEAERINVWNRAAEQMFGYTAKEAMGKQAYQLLVSQEPSGLAAGEMRRLLGNGPEQPDGKTVEITARRKNGKEFAAELTVSPFEHESDRHATAVFRDISHRKETEAHLIESEHRLHTIVESIRDIIYTARLDKHYSITYVSPAIEYQLGFTPEELIAKPGLWIEHIHDEDRHRVLETIESKLKVYNHFSVTYRLWNRNRSYFLWFENRIAVERDAAGKPVGIAGTLINTTDQVMAEEKKKAFSELLLQSLEMTIHSIAKVAEARDPYTAGHQQRVADLACAVAEEMGLPENKVHGIRLGAMIHDIGKIQIPAEILAKPSKLTPEERSLVKSHAQIGYEILRDVPFPWPIALITHQHHERLNGSGYPQGLTGDQMIQESRIVAVADVVEAIASHRPYRPSLGIEMGLDEISRGRGTLYDPEVVDACLKLFREKRFRFGAITAPEPRTL